VARHPARYRKRVEKKGLRGCFCVVLGRNPANSLEIYASRTLWFRYEKECGVQVVGLAASYDSAVELLQQMITDVYRDRGSVDSDAIRGGDRPGDGKDHIIGFGYHSKSDRDPFGGTCYRGTGDIVCGSALLRKDLVR
jgi:hypothetical protein